MTTSTLGRLSAAVGGLLFWAAAPGTVRADGPVDFDRDIAPLLKARCLDCHGPAKRSAGLRLDSPAAIAKGGNSGPLFVAGKPAESTLIHAVTGTKDAALMPPKGPRLTEAEVAKLKAWVEAGAPSGPSVGGPVDDLPVKSDHWSFRKPVRPALPEVKNAAWAKTDIDRFVLARLERAGIAPAPEADRVTLLRRVSLDLTGLPPSPAEAEAFLKDESPDAYAKLVERLLASPHYGERQAKHWLDAARYADSNGYTIDSPRQMWKWREWVIAAFNDDMPFDRFTVEQLAGDMLPAAGQSQRVATGFHRNTLVNEEGGTDKEQFRIEAVYDRTATTGTVWLGLTVGCAQCHDHKFDPVSQRDYYRLMAFFNNSDEPKVEFASAEKVAARDALTARSKPLETALYEKVKAWERGLTPETRAKLPAPVLKVLDTDRDQRNPAQRKVIEAEIAKGDADLRKIVKEIADLAKAMPAFDSSLAIAERATAQARKTFVHIRGDFLRRGVEVAPGVPMVFPQLPLAAGARPSRLDLARWLVGPDNPLTARVTINRVWQEFFGAGLVETENDFGLQGSLPTHPDVLDWLAVEWPARGWRMKELHRLIVLSATYRQSSRRRADLEERDPRNKLLARQSRLRLDAEVVRDAGLTASGLLSRKIGGPSVFPPQPAGADAFTQTNKAWRTSPGEDAYRRGMYTHLWRSAPHPLLTVFDAPDGNATCTRRNRSNTPLQALTLANDAAFLEFARALAARTLKEIPAPAAGMNGAHAAHAADGAKADSAKLDAARIRHAFRLCVVRDPSPAEAGRLGDLLAKARAAYAASPDDAVALASAPMPAAVAPVPRAGKKGAPKVEAKPEPKPDAKPAPVVDRVAAVESAAWITIARALMNLDEFITRE